MALHNLPVRLSSFIGRTSELATLAEFLKSHRLVTITGSGGAGKTRLALQVCEELAESFDGGAWWVELAPLNETDGGPVRKSENESENASENVSQTDPEIETESDLENGRLIDVVAQAVGTPFAEGRRDFEAVVNRVGNRSTLIILDNCEHVRLPVARLVDALLRQCQNLRVLTTSRVPLNVPGELTWRVPPLGLPDLTLPERGGESSRRDLCAFDSVRLFADRARNVRSTFAVTEENASAIAAICHRLYGIPLAIELAATRTKSLLPSQILSGLDDSLRLLAGGSLVVLPRHQTLEASIQWSAGLLTNRGRNLLHRLSVFRGSFDLAGVKAVCSDLGIDAGIGAGFEVGTDGQIEAGDVLDLLESLIDHSLVLSLEGEDAGRFTLLETVRQFGLRQLQREATAEHWQSRHATYYAHVVKKRAPGCESSEQFASIAKLTFEIDNIRVMLAWLRDHKAALALGDVVSDLGAFWNVGGDRVEGVAWSTRALDLLTPESSSGAIVGSSAKSGVGSSAVRARILANRAEWNLSLGDPFAALQDCNAAISMGREVGDLRAQGRGNSVRTTLFAFGAPQLWRKQWDKTFDIVTRDEDHFSRTNLLLWVAVPLLVVGRTKEGLAALEEARPAVMAHGQPMMMANLWIWEALGSNHAGRPVYAESLVARSLASNALGSPHRTAGALTMLEVSRGWRGLRKTERKQSSGELAKARRDGETFAAEIYSLLGALEVLRHDPLEARRRVDGWLASSNESTLTKPPGLLLGAHASLLAKDVDDAKARSLKIIDWTTKHGEVLYRYRAMVTLAAAHLLGGETTLAENSVREAIDALIEHGNYVALPEAIEVLGAIAAACGNGVEAARLFGATSSARIAMETPLSIPYDTFVYQGHDRARKLLGDEHFEAHLASGAALSISETIAFVERTRGQRGRPSLGWSSLTPTERSVAELIRDGLTNREIAQRLLMGSETVKTHLSHIFSKLDITKRSQLAAIAVEQIRNEGSS